MRERREDISSLVTHFVDILGRRIGRRINQVPEDTMHTINPNDWPGNIRELQKLIVRAVILSDDGVLPNPLPTIGAECLRVSPAPTTLLETERALIHRTLESTGWLVGGRDSAAVKLGLKRTTLIYKMRRHGISRPSSENDLTMSEPAGTESDPLPQWQ